MVLRNVVPRQGTETIYRKKTQDLDFIIIEKCSSPTGDGNNYLALHGTSIDPIEKCSSPTGDGNLIFANVSIPIFN